MLTEMLRLTEKPQGIVFKVYVQPKSAENRVSGIYDDAIKIKVKAPPVEGAANKMCIKYLSKLLNTPKSSFQIMSGHSSRVKIMLIKYKKNESPHMEFARLKRLLQSLVS